MVPLWLKLVPYPMRARMGASPNLRKLLFNTGWLVGDQILRIVIGLFVGIWVARYLGTQQFGLLNFAMAFTSLFGVVAGLGLGGVAVRDLIKEPAAAGVTLGTAFVLRTAGGFLGLILAVSTIGFVRPDDEVAKLIVALLSLVMVLKASEVAKYWFESQTQSKYFVLVESGAFLLFSAVKLGLIISRATLLAFVWAALAEAALVAVAMLAVCSWRGIRLRAWRLRWDRATALLGDSWPLILSALAIMIYMRIDQIMLGMMLGDQTVGVYAAAVHISEVWYFVPTAIVGSAFPAIVELQRQGETRYKEGLQRLYDLMVRLTVAVAIPMTFFSTWIVNALYGPAFRDAGVVLAVHVWAGVFVSLGVSSGRILLVENLQVLAFYRTLAGAAVNVAANLALIPTFGVAGAAVGTVIAQCMAAYLFDSLHPRLRSMFMMKTAAFVRAFGFGGRR